MREYYYPFESGLKAGTAEVYEHEMPGGQYSNLQRQALGLGLADNFNVVKKNYVIANRLLGDIIKVTPSSKVVGDLALFMTSNGLSEDDIWQKGSTLSFPESVKNLLKGELGQPYGGFPEAFQKLVLKDEQPLTERPNAHLAPVDFDNEFEAFKKKYNDEVTFLDFLSAKLYPKVYDDYHKHWQKYGTVQHIATKAFYYGMREGDEILVTIGEGKTLIIRYVGRTLRPNADGNHVVSFEMNGQSRRIRVKDTSFVSDKPAHRKATTDNAKEIGSPLQGRISAVKVKAGDEVKENTPLFTIEAMKMETIVAAPVAGKIKSVVLPAGTVVMQDDLVIEVE